MPPAAPRIKMYGYEIPFHIQEEIMKRLPVKSLLQFRSVSKAWKSLIDSSEFIAAHSLHRHTQKQQHLLVSYGYPMDEAQYVSYIDDDTFPQQRSLLTLPLSVKELNGHRVVGSSRGLLCLYGFGAHFTIGMAVIWNPSIRKSIAVALHGRHSLGFGVCPVTNDPKIVSIKQYRDSQNVENNYRCEVMVYTLSTGKWRSLSNNLPIKLIREPWSQVVTSMFIYWQVGTNCETIMSFDLTSESFGVIILPDSIARYHPLCLCISKLRESLAILQYGINMSSKECTVWMMEDGVQGLFTKLFTIRTPHNHIAGFRKNGIPIMNVTDGSDYYNDPANLVVYEPNSEYNNVLEICASVDSFHVNSYVETLLLLGRSDCESH